MSGEAPESGQRDTGRSQRGRVRLWTTIRRCLIALPVAIALAQGPIDPTAITQHVLGAWEAALTLVLLCDLGLRAVYAHFRKTSLLQALGRTRVAWMLVLAGLAGASFAVGATLVLVLVGMGALLTLRLSRPHWGHRTYPARPRGDRPAGEKTTCPLELTSREHPDGHELRLRIRGRLGLMAKRSLSSRREPVLGLTLTLTTIAIGMATAGLAWAVGPEVLIDIQGGGRETTTKTATTSTTTSAPNEQEPPVRAESTTTTTQTYTAGGSSHDSCPPPRGSVGEQTEAEIQELYTGEAVIDGQKTTRYPLPERTGPAPGRREGECTKEFHEQITPLGTFVWAWGQNSEDGEVMSIAVDSKVYGPAVFLAPAAQQVRRLIAHFGIVGGIRRYEAGTGDFYPVRTPAGTFLLIRREKSEEYELLPPEAAQKWAQAIKPAHGFLWPVALRKGGWGLYTDAIPSEMWSYVPAASWSTEEPELGEAELQQDAAKAHRP